MAASETDVFCKVGDPGTATTMTAPGHTTGGTSISVVSTANYPTTTGVIFAIDTVTIVNGEEVRDTGSYTEWEGTVGGATTLENMVLRLGTDQNYPAGSTTRVYIPVAASQNDRMVDGLLVSHDQDGTLKAGAVDNAACLATGIVGNTNLLTAAGDIGGAWKSFTSTITGFASFVDNTVRYTQVGKTVMVYMSISGTSNATGFTLTMPVAAHETTTAIVWITDNTTTVRAGLLSISSSTLTVYSDPSGAPWTNSGSKRLRQAIFVYEAA